MLRVVAISCVCAAVLSATETITMLDTIELVSSTGRVFKDIRGEEIKSADLGEALTKDNANISMIRRSGISNDIVMRGHKKDNLTVTIDGAKVCGACPNRMDPPVSHVLTNNIDYIEINEGPFNVADFGSLAGDVKIHTLKPTKETKGELSINAGSWDYLKGAFMLSGGSEKLRFLLSGSAETGGQYKDGNGDTLAEQTDKAPLPNRFQTKYKEMDAFTKKTLMGKIFWDITPDQELALSYTMNNSDDVLYPNTAMDALYDDSNVYILGYTAKNLGSLSKKLKLDIYRSTVEHPMATKYRNAANIDPDGAGPKKAGYMTSYLETEMMGAKLANTFDAGNHEITVGLDGSKRNWDGHYSKTLTVAPFSTTTMHKSIDDVDTTNYALFAKDKITLNDELTLEAGARYDDTTIDKHNIKQHDFTDVTGYMFAKYDIDNTLNIFGGAGHSVRVPDPKELYFTGPTKNVVGNPNLNTVKNNEIDLGIEKRFDKFNLKAKTFYSQVGDYIAYNNTSKKYENVDATLYGFDISGLYAITDNLTARGTLAYTKGEKDKPLAGQTETNMPDIAPLRATLGVEYEVENSYKLEANMQASAPWTTFDGANGEQKLDSYTVFNIKGTKIIGDGFEISAGVDNIFDTTYIASNTYADLTLLQGGGAVMTLNEPGRYFYTQLKYKF